MSPLPVWFALYAAPALAGEFTGAEVAAMGGAANAAVDDNAAITANPAALGLAVRYDLSGAFQYGPQGDLGWGGAVVDSRTAPRVAFGVAYVGGVTTPPLAVADLPGWKLAGETLDPERRDHQVDVAIAAPLLDHRLSVGLSGEVLFYDREVGGSGTTGNLDVGLGARPLPWIAVGLAARDLVPTNDAANHPLQLAAGARVLTEYVTAALDLDHTPTYAATDVAGGLEGRLGYAALRIGGRDSGETGARHLTWGLGFAGDGASLDYAMAVPVGGRLPGDGLAHRISLTFAAPDLDRAHPDDRF